MRKISIILLLLYFCVLFYVIYKNNHALKSRLYALEKGEKMTDGDKYEKSLFERLISPIFKSLTTAVSSMLPISKEAEAELKVKLMLAGISYGPREYAAIQVFCYIASILLAVIISVNRKMDGTKTFLSIFLAIYAVYVILRFSLSSKITQRKEKIEDEMPDVMDLLSVSVVAGLSFDQALKYVVERSEGILVDELAVAQNEIALGRGRSEALRKLADRCQVDSLNSFVGAVIQAEVLGIPISNILQTQSANIRQMQQDRKEEKAAKLPVKILIPLVFLIFPTMFIVILGPAIPRILVALG